VKNQHPVAKWEHIEKLYKSDRDRPIRVLFKVTDTHLAPVIQCHESELGSSSHEPHSSSGTLRSSHRVAAELYALVANGK
jgi:hypothetical protein